MPKGFYYLIATLPFLSLDKELTISQKTFLEESEKWLTPKEYKKLLDSTSFETAQEFQEEDVVNLWKLFDEKIRTQIKKTREKKIEGLSAGQGERDVQDIVKETDPLKREYLLAQKKMEVLEELGQGHDFDLEAVIIYYLKLVIIERLKKFDEQKGAQVFEHLCEVKHEQS